MKKVLIVIDAQNDFLTGSLANPAAVEALPCVCDLVEDAVAEDLPIIWTRDTHFEDYLNSAEGMKLPIPHCIHETWGWQIANEVILPNYFKGWIIDKYQFGAKPEDWIEAFEMIPEFYDCSSNDREIHICGYVSSICVVSNALILKSLYPESKIIFHAYASAGLTPEDHEAACKVMECCQIKVLREAE